MCTTQLKSCHDITKVHLIQNETETCTGSAIRIGYLWCMVLVDTLMIQAITTF